MSETSVQDIKDSLPDEGYLLDVNEVAELLGVTRTRVSQLTSAGLLSFERKRVGVRNRLFYRRSEVLAYQKNYYGRQISVTMPQASWPQPTSHGVTVSADESKTSSESRVGATSASSSRMHSMVPEHLYLETARLISQDTNNSHLLARLQQTLNQITSKISWDNKTNLPSAIEIDSQEKLVAQLDAIQLLLKSLDLKIDQQNENFESIFLEFATLRKHLHQQDMRQRILQGGIQGQCALPGEILQEHSNQPPLLKVKAPPKKTSRRQTVVKKRISQR